jgi:hypothetical protein
MTRKTAKTSKPGHEWIPLIEGARRLARLGGPPPWPPKVRAETGAKLVEALRLGRIASRGDPGDSGRLKRLSAKDWQSMRPDIDNNRLLPLTPSGRRYPPDGFVNVEVSATDIQRIFGSKVAGAERHPGPGSTSPIRARRSHVAMPSVNKRKRAAVISAIRSLGVEDLAHLKQKVREDRIVSVVEESTGLKVCGRYASEHYRTLRNEERS